MLSSTLNMSLGLALLLQHPSEPLALVTWNADGNTVP